MQDFRDFEDNSADKNLDYPGRKEYDSGMLVQHFLKFCVEEGREGDHGTVVHGKKKEVVVGILLMEGVTWRYYDGGGPLWAPGRKVKEGKEPGDVAGDVWVYDGIIP